MELPLNIRNVQTNNFKLLFERVRPGLLSGRADGNLLHTLVNVLVHRIMLYVPCHGCISLRNKSNNSMTTPEKRKSAIRQLHCVQKKVTP